VQANRHIQCEKFRLCAEDRDKKLLAPISVIVPNSGEALSKTTMPIHNGRFDKIRFEVIVQILARTLTLGDCQN